MGWSQAELAGRADVSTGMVAMVETGRANVSVDLAGRLLTTLGVSLDVRFVVPFVEPRQRDAAHARSVAYVQRRLERAGFRVRREVEVGSGRSHGWIDLLAWHPNSGVLLVVEVKTEIHDVGQIERTLGWYGREARRPAREMGWHPTSIGRWLLVLATEANDQRLVENREALGQSFPARVPPMPGEPGQAPGLAMFDPSSRRRSWLIRARIDGRRSVAPYRDYRDFVGRRITGSAGGRSLPSSGSGTALRGRATTMQSGRHSTRGCERSAQPG